MSGGKVSYDSGQHEALESELKNIGDNFDNLISEYQRLQSSVDSHLEGNAATALTTELSSLLSKLQIEKDNWSTVIKNANTVEALIKAADKKSQEVVEGNKSKK
ncbi:peptidase [Streptococcus uberis]|uniref:peptidase n=1 Tax=Streptococcus uberis TaxID=1349 RepID=UPI0012B5F568|nr:peptidase [Streptococcus uberis]MCK1191053.1 peptidase [Streptococcus uberis]MCK1209177.1 peptidase [Streptococcus uberis]MCK1236210.1 peptidase [Streptococcus uberis]MTB48098.1 peptidase [Streptococcus uberis]MTB99908.1 peptidase [Streptococcus uberis]